MASHTPCRIERRRDCRADNEHTASLKLQPRRSTNDRMMGLLVWKRQTSRLGCRPDADLQTTMVPVDGNAEAGGAGGPNCPDSDGSREAVASDVRDKMARGPACCADFGLGPSRVGSSFNGQETS